MKFKKKKEQERVDVGAVVGVYTSILNKQMKVKVRQL